MKTPTLAVFAAAIALGASANAASAIDVKKSVDVKAEPAAVWEAIGEWCAIKDWHPAIKECEATGEKRVLTTGDGAKINETQTAKDAMSYSYIITESPLPVENYKAKVSVAKGADGGSKVSWDASFDSKGDAKKAEETIAGIFDAGLANVKKMLAK